MILITGATGTTGSKLVDILMKRLPRIRILVRDSGTAAHLSPDPRIEVVHGDFRENDSVLHALEGVEKLFLLSPGEPGMVATQSGLITLAKQAGVKHIVKLSSLGAAPRSEVPFLNWHAASEKALEASGVPYTHIRPNYYMQNLLYFYVPSIEETGELRIPAGNGKVSIVDANDVAAVAAEVLLGDGHQGRTYEVTGPEALTFSEIATRISDCSGRGIRYVDVPPEQALDELKGMDCPDWQAEALVALYRYLAEGKAAKITHTVEELTHRQPRTIWDFCKEFSPAFRKAAA